MRRLRNTFDGLFSNQLLNSLDGSPKYPLQEVFAVNEGNEQIRSAQYSELTL